MSLHNYTIDEIWNSTYMQTVRKDMAEGKKRFECKACYNAEVSSLGSYRLYINNEWRNSIGPFDSLLSESYENDFNVLSSPIYFHFITSNQCNLKCRMCNSWLSSQVKNDPVHNKWSSHLHLDEPDIMLWRKGKNIIGPEIRYGVKTKGFYDIDALNEPSVRWTAGKASIYFSIPKNLTPDKLSVTLSATHPPDHRLKITINNHRLFNSKLPENIFNQKFNISHLTNDGNVSLYLTSDTFRNSKNIPQRIWLISIQLIQRLFIKSAHFFLKTVLRIDAPAHMTHIDSRKLGIALQVINEQPNSLFRIKLIRKWAIQLTRLFVKSIQNIDTFMDAIDRDVLKKGVGVKNVEVTCVESKMRIGQPDNRNFLPADLNESLDRKNSRLLQRLIDSPRSLKELHFSGGEPLIQKGVEDIIDHLVEKKAVNDILLKFNTNCTVLPDRMMDTLQKFHHLYMALSIDAYGPYYEYIRYPGKWDTIVKNIEKLKTLGTARIVIVPVLQVYNALNIVELLKFADTIEVECLITLLSSPLVLNVSVLPEKIKHLSSQRIMAYADISPDMSKKDHYITIANSILSMPDNCTHENINDLIKFTNDLDVTRNQNFKKVHDELLHLIHEEGFHWTDEKKFA